MSAFKAAFPERGGPVPPAAVVASDMSKGARLSDAAYHELRRMIVDGELGPGARLTERALAKLLQISPTPIREAIQRLEQEWLIERRGPRTVVVAGAKPRHARGARGGGSAPPRARPPLGG